MSQGLFLTFEGIEGSGKSTQLALLQQHLEGRGRVVRATREPGGTALGRQLRALLLDPASAIGDEAELFLYLADRAQNVRELVEPAVARGEIVLCDRHADATLAYQGVMRGLGLDRARELNRIATRGRVPDRTLLFDLPAAEGLARASGRRPAGEAADRLEAESLEFHEGVRQAYRELARLEPRRFLVFDARPSPADVHARVLTELEPLLA